MGMIYLGRDLKEKYGWKRLPSEYEEKEYNGYQVVKVHEKLYTKICNIKKYQKKGWDSVILIDGARRSGKSTLAKTIGYLINPDGTIKNFVPSLELAPDRIANAKEEDYLIFDEGSLVANSKQVMGRKNVQLEKIIDVVGSKRLVMMFVMPSFFSIAKAIAIEHSRFLIHIIHGKKLERGKFIYFGTKKKKILYSIGKKNFGSYKKPKSNWNGKFVDFKLPFEKDYDKLKAESLRDALGINPKRKTEDEIKKEVIIALYNTFRLNSSLPIKEICKGFGISERTGNRYSAKQLTKSNDARRALTYSILTPTTNSSIINNDGVSNEPL